MATHGAARCCRTSNMASEIAAKKLCASCGTSCTFSGKPATRTALRSRASRDSKLSPNIALGVPSLSIGSPPSIWTELEIAAAAARDTLSTTVDGAPSPAVVPSPITSVGTGVDATARASPTANRAGPPSAPPSLACTVALEVQPTRASSPPTMHAGAGDGRVDGAGAAAICTRSKPLAPSPCAAGAARAGTVANCSCPPQPSVHAAGPRLEHDPESVPESCCVESPTEGARAGVSRPTLSPTEGARA